MPRPARSRAPGPSGRKGRRCSSGAWPKRAAQPLNPRPAPPAVAPPSKTPKKENASELERVLASHVYHLPRGRVPERFIVCGRRERAMKIIPLLKNNAVRFDGDFYLGTGMHEGVELGVCSHGIGGPSAVIAMHELVA